MTGRELMLYILEHNLEETNMIAFVLSSGNPIGYLSRESAALSLNVGTATVDTLFKRGRLEGITFNENTYFQIPIMVKNNEKMG